MAALTEFIFGGQRSGKSRRAEQLASQWLAQCADHKALLIATAVAWDDEMAARIRRHQQDRAERVPGMRVVEEQIMLAQAIQTCSNPQTLVIVDCLTLWLTNLCMPHENAVQSVSNSAAAPDYLAQAATISGAIRNAAGPLVLVGNEIGLGVIPMGRETREFVDALGRLNQDVAAACERVTFMAAGLPMFLKGHA